MLRSVRAQLAPGGLFAAAIADPFDAVPAERHPSAASRHPRARRLGVLEPAPIHVRAGWVRGIDRARQAVSPGGDMHRGGRAIVVDVGERRTSSRRRPARPACAPVRQADRLGDPRPHRQHGGPVPPLRVRVCALYPELMNIYADRGNIAVLRARCEWRGLGFERAATSLGESLDPDAHDLFYMGGGQDRDQVAVAARHGRDEARRPARAPPTAARSCWPCAAATSCSATPTSWAARSFRASDSWTFARSASRASG